MQQRSMESVTSTVHLTPRSPQKAFEAFLHVTSERVDEVCYFASFLSMERLRLASHRCPLASRREMQSDQTLARAAWSGAETFSTQTHLCAALSIFQSGNIPFGSIRSFSAIRTNPFTLAIV